MAKKTNSGTGGAAPSETKPASPEESKPDTPEEPPKEDAPKEPEVEPEVKQEKWDAEYHVVRPFIAGGKIRFKLHDPVRADDFTKKALTAYEKKGWIGKGAPPSKK